MLYEHVHVPLWMPQRHVNRLVLFICCWSRLKHQTMVLRTLPKIYKNTPGTSDDALVKIEVATSKSSRTWLRTLNQVSAVHLKHLPCSNSLGTGEEPRPQVDRTRSCSVLHLKARTLGMSHCPQNHCVWTVMQRKHHCPKDFDTDS